VSSPQPPRSGSAFPWGLALPAVRLRQGWGRHDGRLLCSPGRWRRALTRSSRRRHRVRLRGRGFLRRHLTRRCNGLAVEHRRRKHLPRRVWGGCRRGHHGIPCIAPSRARIALEAAVAVAIVPILLSRTREQTGGRAEVESRAITMVREDLTRATWRFE